MGLDLKESPAIESRRVNEHEHVLQAFAMLNWLIILQNLKVLFSSWIGKLLSLINLHMMARDCVI